MAKAKAVGRVYGEPRLYEKKLARVMERLGVEDSDFNYDRFGASVQFRYKGSLYAFEHTVERAKQRGLGIVYGSDCFAQLVHALEDIARLVERGIYDLQTWVVGLKALPAATNLPDWCKVLGLAEIPVSFDDVKARYRELSKARHPDQGGTDSEFRLLNEAYEEAERSFGKGDGECV